MSNKRQISFTEQVRGKALALGFDLCGFARARRLDEYEAPFRAWCAGGMNAKMNYLCRDIEKRLNPRILFPGSETVVVTGLNYYSSQSQTQYDTPVISRYAHGKDYHNIVAGKLGKLLEFIRTVRPEAEGKLFCDSSQIAEKPWAVQAGLGWQGRNSLVINPVTGSFFFIGILLVNIRFDYDEPFRDNLCGECNRCIERCPTGAINSDRTIDARKCIANLTIESKKPVPAEMAALFEKRIYGCDICQEVCPHNKLAREHNTPEFSMTEELKNLKRAEWISLTRGQFGRLFKESPVMRVGFERFKKNIEIIMRSGS